MEEKTLKTQDNGPFEYISFDNDDVCEECGIFGIYAGKEDVARLTYFGLFALQHRGQESAGIAVSNGKEIHIHKSMGLVSQVFDEESLAKLKGKIAIGHVRYSTTGSSLLKNAQPFLRQSSRETILLGHNGNLINATQLRAKMEFEGVEFESTTDSEIIANLIARSSKEKTEDAIIEAMNKVEGAYSLVIMTEDKLIGVRDPYGIRPLCMGKLDGNSFVIASETCALNVVGAKFVREIEPGEIIVVKDGRVMENQGLPCKKRAICMFEFVYIARPDSYISGRNIHTARRRMGNLLALEYPVEADLVIPVPDTGWPAAIGYSEASKIPFGEGLIKNRYIHRTFIQPDQRLRDLGVKMKLTPLKEALTGKRVVVVEDSIVRGTTTRSIIGLLKDAGAREVHLRISSPPYKFPCFYGIDTFDRSKLLAAKFSVEEIRDYIGADSLGYLSLKGLVRAVDLPQKEFCLACFNCDYPLRISKDVKVSKFALEELTSRK